MARGTLVGGVAAFVAALTWMPAVSAANDPMTAALRETRALQDGARSLRNGATAGAPSDVLTGVAARLRASLDTLVASHHAWAATLEEPRRTALKPDLAQVDEGCARIRQSLQELDDVLAGTAPDRARIQALGRAVGRPARECAQALTRMRRR
jgi:hypothetical protein